MKEQTVKQVSGVYNERCPICNKKDSLIPIVYGEPTMETVELSRKNKLLIGGCIMTKDAPNVRCTRDLVEFYLSE